MRDSDGGSRFKFDEEFTDTLVDLQNRSGLHSKSDVIKRSLALFQIVLGASDKNQQIVIKTDKGDVEINI